jgi:hypothetical protein
MNFDKNALGDILGDFFSPAHLVTLPIRNSTPKIKMPSLSTYCYLLNKDLTGSKL